MTTKVQHTRDSFIYMAETDEVLRIPEGEFSGARCVADVVSSDAGRLLASAADSYHKHFGEDAVEAAEADLLGEAIRVCKELLHVVEENNLEYTDDDVPMNAADAARFFLAKTKAE